MAVVETMFSVLKEMGFFDFIMPFLLVFSVVYGILQRAKLFEKNINATIALAIGFIAVASLTVINAFQTFLPIFSIVIVVILTALMASALLIGEIKLENKAKYLGLIVGIFVFVLGFMWVWPMIFPQSGGFSVGISMEDIISIIFLIVFLGIILAVVYGGEQNG